METTRADWEINLNDVKIISEIASSIQSVVFLCSWRIHQTVVMKMIKGDATHELNIISKCVHPRICQFLGACVRGDQTYMLFEYIPNGNLRTFMASPHSRREKLQIALDVSIGLDYLSNRKPMPVIHRDIKPENILIGEFNNAKICDFGISKMSLTTTSSPKRHTGEVGSIRWTAPEVLLSQKYNNKSDVYSFGMLLKYIWSGVIPYANCPMSFQAAFAKVNGTSDVLSVVDDDKIRTLVERCVSFNPKERPTHSEVATILQGLLFDE